VILYGFFRTPDTIRQNGACQINFDILQGASVLWSTGVSTARHGFIERQRFSERDSFF
jgi:hypothetical protein